MPPRTDLVASLNNLPASQRPGATGGGPNFLSTLALLVPTAAGAAATVAMHSPFALIAGAAVGLFASMAPKIGRQWERAVVLRMGRYVGLKGPGVFTVIPFVDSIATWIDQRTVTTPFAAAQTLTADTVPVHVDAVLFWTVHDPEKAALEVQDYVQAVSWASQTALRDIIGRTSLSDLLRGREQIESELQELIDQRCMPWGIAVQAVEMRDVVIPTSLQDAMSREAQATREKRARIILGEAEVEIAALFDKASLAYQQNPTALHLRAMNMLYEGLKQKGALMLVPSSAVETMGLGGLLGAAALEQQTRAARTAGAEPGEGAAAGPGIVSPARPRMTGASGG